ncbi:hypothetical protein C942_00959 [Photobacterium marinum]|uniref:Phage protein n=1 Tax=Photobacterium marinum TaxID=1056511 RepID=L8JEM7_9GAMM|nr:DUF3164 family protein [Photobacterium marinum]ELR65872.1 hypothetical protein C942_00959 [Photobacterium marinum]
MNTQETKSVVEVPAGYRMNALGDLVPESRIKPIDLIRDELVRKMIADAQQQQKRLAAFKLQAMNEVADFVELSADQYDVKYGGAKGNVTLTSFDGKYRLVRAKGEHRVFDERMQAGKAKLDEIINRRSEGADDLIKALVERAFRVNKQGHIDVNQVLGLRSISEDDPEWTSAIDAMADSIQVIGTSAYLRLYERQENGAYKQIPLDISKV